MNIYAIDCTTWLEEQAVTDALTYLDEKRRGRVRRLRVPLKRAQCVAVGLLLTHVLGDNGVAPDLAYGANGKPHLAHRPDIHFSITHSDKWVFLAVSDCEIGIDAQMPRRVCPRLAARSTTPEELAWVKADTEPNFTRLWTMKEAYLKYTGTGLTVPIREVTITVPPMGGYDAQHECYWILLSYENVPLSVCSAEPHKEIGIETIKSLP